LDIFFFKTGLYSHLVFALEDEKSGGGLGGALGLGKLFGLDLGGAVVFLPDLSNRTI
jgi:hypothetical protein